jgi:hypothetical protein
VIAEESLGVTLGRPQALPAEGQAQPTPDSGVLQAGFVAPAGRVLRPTVVDSTPATSDFATGAPVWGAPAAPAPLDSSLGGGFGADNSPAPMAPPTGGRRVIASTDPAAVGRLEPVPAGVTSSPSCCGDAADCCCTPGCLGRLENLFHCCRTDCCYASAEYFLWWIKSYQAPPLVTNSPDASGGVIGSPGTTVLFGGPIDPNVFSGGRFTLGIWLDGEKNNAIEANYFFLGQRAVKFSANSNDFPVLARPFFDLNAGSENSLIIASPGLGIPGSITIRAPSEFWGTELDYRCNLWRGCHSRLDLLAGFRYLELKEGLDITSFSEIPQIGGGLVEPLRTDQFDTFNQFFGGQLGLLWECRAGRWSLDLRAKVALGETSRSVNIQGNTLFTAPGGTTGFPGGLLALPSNIGRFHEERFGVVPEMGLNVGYQLTEGLRFFVGYTFIYWSNVFRPGDQIDRVIDTTQLPPAPPNGQARPMVPLKSRDFWAQGMNFGLEYRY